MPYRLAIPLYLKGCVGSAQTHNQHTAVFAISSSGLRSPAVGMGNTYVHAVPGIYCANAEGKDTKPQLRKFHK